MQNSHFRIDRTSHYLKGVRISLRYFTIVLRHLRLPKSIICWNTTKLTTYLLLKREPLFQIASIDKTNQRTTPSWDMPIEFWNKYRHYEYQFLEVYNWIYIYWIINAQKITQETLCDKGKAFFDSNISTCQICIGFEADYLEKVRKLANIEWFFNRSKINVFPR